MTNKIKVTSEDDSSDEINIKQMKQDLKEKHKKERRENFKNFALTTKDVIISIWQMLVFASICFMIGIIFNGTDDNTLKFLTLPAASYAAYLLISKFLKK